MDNLSNTIYQTYSHGFTELTQVKQFHFASRLAAWQSDNWARTQLQILKPTLVPSSEQAAKVLIKNLLHTQPSLEGGINEYETRQHYFSKYPWLYGLHLTLLQLRHWFYVYNYDGRESLGDCLDAHEIDELIDGLLTDVAACQTLSTYAVNTAYLWQRFVNQNNTAALFKWWRPRAQTDAITATLDSYFITHCIIADSLFYARALPTQRLSWYRLRMIETDETIAQRLDEITTDALLETIVTHKLIGTSSPHQQAILARCQSEFDASLGYLTDPRKPAKNNFADSEHRNVLYLMATTQPQTKLLSLAD